LRGERWRVGKARRRRKERKRWRGDEDAPEVLQRRASENEGGERERERGKGQELGAYSAHDAMVMGHAQRGFPAPGRCMTLHR